MKPNSKNAALIAALLTLLIALPTACRGESVSWSQPDLDTWVYPNAFFGAGIRPFAPSFGTALAIDPSTNTLLPGGATRLGSLVFAFETLSDIPAGLNPSQYAINSVSITTTYERGQGGPITYSSEPITPDGVLADLQADMLDAFPMELFGVGFTDTFDGFALGVDPSGDRFSEASSGWVGGQYAVFPSDDGVRDATNNINGGFSATETSNETAPFVASPFAIGTVAGASEDDALPNDTEYVFDVDLTNAKVVDYLQRSLSEGVLGFAVSSLQAADAPPVSGATVAEPQPYPQWYTKEAIGLFENAAPPTLTIDFEIVPLAGDYNDDGAVDQLDYAAWAAAYGTSDALTDGNRDGVVDTADYTIWRDAYAATPAIAVPEPGGRVYALAVASTIAFCFGTVLFTRPRRPQ